MSPPTPTVTPTVTQTITQTVTPVGTPTVTPTFISTPINVSLNTSNGDYQIYNIVDNTYSKSTVLLADVLDTSFNADIFINKITVGGNQNGRVLIKINNNIISELAYAASKTVQLELQPKILMPIGSYLEEILESGTAGTHSISIIGEVIK